MSGKIMLIGLGGVAKSALQIMATRPEIGEIIVASRNAQEGLAFGNLVSAGAMAQGYSPQIRFTAFDLTNIEESAEIISRENPDVIFSTATLMSPWRTGNLPLEINMTLYPAGFGVWLPMHLPLTTKLMQAVRLADYNGFTLTAPFPDVVNCMLSKIGLAPTCGIGNVDLFIPKIKRLSAEALGVATEEIRVRMVAHHALMPYFMGLAGDHVPPFHLSVTVGTEDVTDRADARKRLSASLPAIVGPETNYVTASSAARLIVSLLSEREIEMHAPAPNGLPGGYPVTVSNRGVQPALAELMAIDAAIKINEDAHQFDGIQHIESDGTAVFTETATDALSNAFNLDCKRLHPDHAQALADELLAKVQESMQRP